MLNRRENIRKCYVCHKEVNGDCIYLTGGIFRHEQCCIGSPNWFKFKTESKYNILFEKKGEEIDKS